MNKFSSQLTIFFIFSAFFYGAYYILLHDNFLHLSIHSIINRAHHLDIKKHLLVLGLLPVYIAAILFGAAVLGIYVSHALHKDPRRKDK